MYIEKKFIGVCIFFNYNLFNSLHFYRFQKRCLEASRCKAFEGLIKKSNLDLVMENNNSNNKNSKNIVVEIKENYSKLNIVQRKLNLLSLNSDSK